MQGSEQNPVSIGELPFVLFVDLQNDLVKRLFWVVPKCGFLGDRFIAAFGLFQLNGTCKSFLQLVV